MNSKNVFLTNSFYKEHPNHGSVPNVGVELGSRG